MKFAHEFKEALVREGFPAHWVESAIPYGQLKKCIKKVEEELRNIGLDSTTLAQFDRPDGTFHYGFKGEKERFRPKLTLSIRLEDGLAIDASLSPDTRKYLEELALSQSENPVALSKHPVTTPPSPEDEHVFGSDEATDPLASSKIQQVEIPLTFDSEFFGLLQSDVSALDIIQDTEQESLAHEIVALSSSVTSITKPSKYSKSDLYRWRELFELYLEAAPFFSTRECDSGSRNSTTAAQQLRWFQGEVTKRGIVKSFRLPASHQALNRFVSINITLLQNLSFQEINQKAISKILKKFDKRTKLGAAKTFPKLLQSDSIMSEKMAKAVCAQMSTYIVQIVPQVDDHLCPICFTIYWRPIRMQCKHVFCIRCTVLMQREKKKFCPLCRDDVIMKADTDNIDAGLVKYLKKYFPRETREKQVALEIASGIEQFGVSYRHPSQYDCTVM